MHFLILSVVFSVLIVTILKLFARYKIDTFQAIVINYWICVATGSVELGHFPIHSGLLEANWLGTSFILGSLFISAFYAAGITLQRFGLTIATVVQKMSLLLSVPFALWLFAESLSLLKIIGILLALLAVILVNILPKQENEAAATKPWWEWLFPVVLLCCCGTIECILQYVQGFVLQGGSSESSIFSIVSFGFAAIFGTIILGIGWLRGQVEFQRKNFAAGIILGIPNYFSIFFLLQALNWADKSVVLPINNIAVVLVCAMMGLLLFGERLSKLNWAGVTMAILAIVLLSNN